MRYVKCHDRGHDLGGAYSHIRMAPVPIRLWYGTGSSPSHIPHYLTIIDFLQEELGH